MIKTLREIPYPIWLIALGHGVADLAPGALCVALPFLKAKLGLSYADVSIIVLMQNMAASLSQPIFGYYSDRSPKAWIMPAGCLLCGLSMLASLLAFDYYWVLFFIALSGLGNAAFHPEAAKIVNYLSGKSIGKGASLFSVWGSAGVAGGSIFMAFLLSDSVPGNLYWFLLPFFVSSAGLTYIAITLPQKATSNLQSLRGLKTFNWSLLSLLGMVASRATVTAGISTFIPLYYVSYLQGSPLYASYLLTVFALTGAVGTLAGGIMSDTYGGKTVMLISILPLSVLLFLLHFSEGIWPFIILALCGILLSATFTSSLVLIQKMMPQNVGTASGLNLGFSTGLGTMGVLALGQIADTVSLPVVFYILAGLPVIGFILTIFVQEPQENKAIA